MGTTLCTAFAVRKLNRIKTVLLVLPKGSKLRCRFLIFIHGDELKKNISFRFLFTDMKVEGNDFTWAVARRNDLRYEYRKKGHLPLEPPFCSLAFLAL